MGAFGEAWVSMWEGVVTMLDESQMTVAGAIQCRYPPEFDLDKALFT